MTRITPRTCLYPLTGSLLLTFGLSLGLTFRSNHHCYAGTCGESLFPLSARLHVVVWYCWLSLSVAFLAIQAFSPELQRVLEKRLVHGKLPLLGKELPVSGALVVGWILSLYGILVGVWWMTLQQYFSERGRDGGVYAGNNHVAAIAMTGHLADVTMGMTLIPISRHSALASFFKLSVSTTLTFHMMVSYTLFLIVLVHAFLYTAWALDNHALSSQLERVFPVLNPTYLYHEVWPSNKTSIGIWRASLIFTGIVTIIVMLAIFITTLRPVRKNHFNLFYFTHFLGIAATVIICLHASTMLYCTAPGLAMWVLDWGMRFYELRQRLDATLSSLGSGWYCLSLGLPRRRLDGCACSSPLAHFYIHHSKSSTRELHPFTTITHLASQNLVTSKASEKIPIRFLFRKSTQSTQLSDEFARKDGFAKIVGLFGKERKSHSEWTDKLASLADTPDQLSPEGRIIDRKVQTSLNPASSVELGPTDPLRTADIPVRLEGPYFTPVSPSEYNTVVCLVAGTGISGAIAIAGAFAESKMSKFRCEHRGIAHRRACSSRDSSSRKWKRCIIVWSVRDEHYIDLPFFQELKSSGLEVQTHLTGEGRSRLDMVETLQSIHKDDSGSLWVYLSGPNRFIEAGEKACRALAGVDWFAARWDV